jgi:glycosyltransferase involved in cell wall biosynthesis
MKHLVILPAYNESEALPRALADLEILPEEFEFVIVNDGSKDETGVLAEKLARASRRPIHVVHLPFNGGIGAAMQAGYLFARKAGCYRYVIQFDADGQHDARFVAGLVQECEAQGLDLCVGSRFREAEAGAFRSTFLRRQGSRVLSALMWLLSGTWVTDPTSGFRCAGPRAWAHFAARYPDDYPEPESLFWCAKNHLKIGERPVTMRPRQGGVSSIRPWHAVYYMGKVGLALLVERLRDKEAEEE